MNKIICAVGLALVMSAVAHANSFTVDSTSVTGNYHGTLTIDSRAGVNFGFTDSASHVTAAVDLYALSEFPGELYWYGGASIATPYGSASDTMGGGGGGGFLPGHPTSNDNNHGLFARSANFWDGHTPYYSVLTFSFMFGFPVSWDGTNLTGNGTWSVTWSEANYTIGTNAPYVAVPDGSSTLRLLVLALGIMLGVKKIPLRSDRFLRLARISR